MLCDDLEGWDGAGREVQEGGDICILMADSQVVLVVKSPPAKEGDLKDAGSIPRSGRSPGGGHGNPLQYPCLENPMDRGAWWVIVHRAAKSRTPLKQLGKHVADPCCCTSETNTALSR